MSMNDIAIKGIPGGAQKVLTDTTHRVAKMSNKQETPKIQTLLKRWQEELAKVTNEVKTTVETKVAKGKEVLENAGTNVKDFFSRTFRVSARKLKVNKIVAEKSLNAYGEHNGIVLQVAVEPKEEKAVETSNINDMVREELVNEKSMMDSRVSRLERTGEVKVASETVDTPRTEPIYDTPIINTPTRFERHKDTQFDALINDNANISSMPVDNTFENHERTFETKGGDPDLYNELIRGNSKFGKVQEAKRKLSTIRGEREKATAVNADLAKEVEDVKRTIEEIKRKQKEEEELELSNTMNMIGEEEEKILFETRKYDTLKAELAALIRERDSLLGNSSYKEEGYSRRMAS